MDSRVFPTPTSRNLGMLLSISFFAMRILQYLAEQETGASLGLQIDLPDVLPDDPQGEEDQPPVAHAEQITLAQPMMVAPVAQRTME